MRADIHDGPEQMLQSKAGYIDARPLTANPTNLLATHGRTIHPGQTEKNSVRAYVFRFALKLGHCSMHSACLKGARGLNRSRGRALRRAAWLCQQWMERWQRLT